MKKILLSITFIVISMYSFAQETTNGKEATKEKINAAIQPILEKKFKERTEKLKGELKLSDAQFQKFSEIENKRMNDVKQLMGDAVTGKKISEEEKQKLEEKEKQYDGELEKILTPEQYQRYIKIREEASKKTKKQMNKKYKK